MSDRATLKIDEKFHDLPVIVGSEGEKAIDTSKLRADTGYVCLDEGYGNTGSCQSKITFIDGEKGILRYRGYPIEQLAEGSSFIESAYLIIYGELPTEAQLTDFAGRILQRGRIHESLKNHFSGFPHSSHPMAILAALLNSLGCYYPDMASNDREKDLEHFDDAVAVLISKVRVLTAMSYRMMQDRPYIYPKPNLAYCENFLHMMFSEPYNDYPLHADVVKALDMILLLHADHEQNCSTSTVRMVASGGANLFASTAAGVCALWGPLHGGANMRVVQMLQSIHDAGDDGTTFIEKARNGEARLMGFGHRVYKNYDPRAKFLGSYAEKVIAALRKNDPLLDIARRLEEKALEDIYFVVRKLYPNVDFYSGIILRAIGIPIDMFTVIFAIGRMPGWIANWKELAVQNSRIYRPRQIYQGPNKRDYVPLTQRAGSDQ